jgi:hypothetical protein
MQPHPSSWAVNLSIAQLARRLLAKAVKNAMARNNSAAVSVAVTFTVKIYITQFIS